MPHTEGNDTTRHDTEHDKSVWYVKNRVVLCCVVLCCVVWRVRFARVPHLQPTGGLEEGGAGHVLGEYLAGRSPGEKGRTRWMDSIDSLRPEHMAQGTWPQLIPIPSSL